MTLETNNQNVMAFYDLMFNQSRPAEVVKHWDVLQVVARESNNDDGMF